MRILCGIFAVLFSASVAGAQVNTNTNPCQSANGAFQVNSGAPYKITLLLPATVTDTNGAQIPTNPKGFRVQIDTGAFQDAGLPPAGTACPSGTAFAGFIPYIIQMTTGVARGNHEAKVLAYYDSVDNNGVPIVVESAVVTLPFAAVDPTRSVFPAPSNGKVIR